MVGEELALSESISVLPGRDGLRFGGGAVRKVLRISDAVYIIAV